MLPAFCIFNAMFNCDDDFRLLEEELLALLHRVFGGGHRVPDCPRRLEDLVVVSALRMFLFGGRGCSSERGGSGTNGHGGALRLGRVGATDCSM